MPVLSQAKRERIETYATERVQEHVRRKGALERIEHGLAGLEAAIVAAQEDVEQVDELKELLSPLRDELKELREVGEVGIRQTALTMSTLDPALAPHFVGAG